MKTTYDIPEALVKEINRIARARGLPARAIVQQALTRVVEEEQAAEPFSLPESTATGWVSLNDEARVALERGDGMRELAYGSFGVDR